MKIIAFSLKIIHTIIENLGISTNLSYLETVKGELGISKEIQTYSGIKNKVLENFDVKTTKSNMLVSIIAKAKIHEEDISW